MYFISNDPDFNIKIKRGPKIKQKKLTRSLAYTPDLILCYYPPPSSTLNAHHNQGNNYKKEEKGRVASCLLVIFLRCLPR
mmetsp:Transcript_13273/g.27866  ORF Transcript_13273/g.27866 Transcript_13273/m.27866 type:complete len:80 (+) Transcript_13273:34-273(+)